MPLNPLTYNDKYFTGVYERGDPLSAQDFDKQFNVVASYINKQIIPYVNNLSVGSVTGSTAPADINKFFRNVGDGAIEFANITNVSFLDYSISWEKLKNANSGSIFASGANQVFTTVNSTASNQLLISRENNSPIWKLAEADNIEDRSISGNKIALASIRTENVYPGTLATQLVNDAVTTNKVVDRAVTTSKIADEAFTEAVLGPALVNSFVNSVSENRIPDNYITAAMLHNYNFNGFTSPNGGTHLPIFNFNISIPNSKFAYTDGGNERLLAPRSIGANQIKRGSINGERLHYYIGNQTIWRPKTIDLIANEAILPEHLSAEMRHRLGV